GLGRDTPAAVTGVLDGSRLAIDTPDGRVDVRLNALGEHNARNALAATAAALAAGVPLAAVKAGLEAFAPVKGRLQVTHAALGSLAGATVIDDTYNANPDSMRAAIDVLAACSAPRVLVIGEMGEVGDEGPAFHREIGAYARERGIDALFALGAATLPACEAYGASARHFDDAAALVAALVAEHFGAHATLLVKGSRFMKMERVVDALANETASGAAPGAH
ncbi:glutamate ligase domain-containing protein, partial [Burkholderia thailandensis]